VNSSLTIRVHLNQTICNVHVDRFKNTAIKCCVICFTTDTELNSSRG